MDKNSSKRDLLSDLPLGVIHDILSFVPIRDAVRTSLLSRKWRYIWASLPHLTFVFEETEFDEKRVIHFISQALLLHNGPIHKAELHLEPMEESQFVDQWLLFLSRNGIRILFLGCPWIEVHSSLYSCQSLTDLRLFVDTIPPPPPSFKGFLFLRSLDIITVRGENCSTVESIVAHSPLLEKFALGCCAVSEMPMTIRAPNLKYFHLRFTSVHLSLSTPLLEEFVGRFSGKKSFSIEGEFHYLRTIKLSNVSFGDKQVTTDVLRLITASPNLQKLEISSLTISISGASELAFASLWDTNCTYDSLKVINMECLHCEIGEMKLLKFLLARSPVLEKMTYKPHSTLSDLELLKLTTELLRYRRASVNAEIVIFDDRVSSSFANLAL